MSHVKITDQEVANIARLSNLTLTEGERSSLRADLEAVLGYVKQLEELDVEGVAPTTHAVPLAPPLRADVVVKSLTRDEALSNAPEQAEGMFQVPRSVEGGN